MDRLAIAEHLFRSTYASLQDPKILISVVQNLLAAIEDAITASLEEARAAKEIPPYGETLNGKLTAYKMHLARKKGIHPVDFMLIAELQEIVKQHHDSPMEFRRKESFVIADRSYAMHVLSADKTKTYIERTRSFVSRA